MGEKEILRKVKSLGLFEPDDSFAPIGPRVREDLSLIVDRASHHGLLKWSPDSRGEFISKKSSRSGLQSLEETIGTSEDIRKSPKHESNRELIERMHREAESFFSARLRPPQC